jgi:TatD DNase family protein
MLFDSHCHLDAEEYDHDRDEVIARAHSVGVHAMMVPGYEPREWTRLKPLTERVRGLVCAVGLHPLYVHELSAEQRREALADLPRWLADTGARAVGECGLDALVARRGGADLDTQASVVSAHLALAHELALPLILHCVKAHGRMLELLERAGPLARGGVMHAYGGPPDLIERYRKLGFRFSFGGIITHENAKRPRSSLLAVPLSSLLLETDGPSQVPAGSGRSRSEPADVARIAHAAAALRGEDVRALIAQTTDNALELFACDRAHFQGADELLQR